MTEHSADTVERVGNAALEHMFDRKGLRHALEPIRDEDPEVWADIVEETGRAALSALTVEDAAKVVLDANIKNQLAKSPAFFLHFHAWEGYKKGVQDYTAALRAIADTPKEGE